MDPRHRINKPIKSEKTMPCYFSPQSLPIPNSGQGWVCLQAKRLVWGLSMARDPLLQAGPCSWAYFSNGEHMLSLEDHCFPSKVLHSPWSGGVEETRSLLAKSQRKEGEEVTRLGRQDWEG